VALKLLEAFGEGRSGEMSLAGRLLPSPSTEGVFMLRNAAAGARLQAVLRSMDKDALAALTRAAAAAWEIDLGEAKLRHEKVGTTAALRLTLPAPAGEGAAGGWQGTLWPALFGEGPVEIFLAVIRSDRVAFAIGKNARAQLATMASGKVGAPNEALADAMTAGGGRSLFYFVDARQLAPLIAGFARHERAAALASGAVSTLPLFGGVRGDPDGRFMSFDLTVPPACFSGLGTIVQRAMMPR
jgi:hypothetical protein